MSHPSPVGTDESHASARLPSLDHLADYRRISCPSSKPPIDEPELHLTFYELTHKLRTNRRSVVVENQFGQFTLRVAAPRIVAVPSLKNDEGVPRDLDDLSHFTCYEASGRRLNLKAALEDQFHVGAPDTILVHGPQYFCNPAAKRHAGTRYPRERRGPPCVLQGHALERSAVCLLERRGRKPVRGIRPRDSGDF